MSGGEFKLNDDSRLLNASQLEQLRKVTFVAPSTMRERRFNDYLTGLLDHIDAVNDQIELVIDRARAQRCPVSPAFAYQLAALRQVAGIPAVASGRDAANEADAHPTLSPSNSTVFKEASNGE